MFKKQMLYILDRFWWGMLGQMVHNLSSAPYVDKAVKA